MKYHSSTPVAPDLYHGKVAHTILDAKALGKALDANYLQAKAEIAEATLFLNERAGRYGRGQAGSKPSMGPNFGLPEGRIITNWQRRQRYRQE